METKLRAHLNKKADELSAATGTTYGFSWSANLTYQVASVWAYVSSLGRSRVDLDTIYSLADNGPMTLAQIIIRVDEYVEQKIAGHVAQDQAGA